MSNIFIINFIFGVIMPQYNLLKENIFHIPHDFFRYHSNDLKHLLIPNSFWDFEKDSNLPKIVLKFDKSSTII